MLGGLLFNYRIFSKESSLTATVKATALMAICVFNAVNVLKVIDSKAESLNDAAVDKYVKIELEDSLLTADKKGKGILRRHHYLSNTHKIANGLVDHFLSLLTRVVCP